MSPPIWYASLKEHVVVRDLLRDQGKGSERESKTEISAHQIARCASWFPLPPLFHRMYK